MTAKMTIDASHIVALKKVLQDARSIDDELQELAAKANSLAVKQEKAHAEFQAQGEALRSELVHIVGRVHKLSNKFYELHETTMQVVDKISGVEEEEGT